MKIRKMSREAGVNLAVAVAILGLGIVGFFRGTSWIFGIHPLEYLVFIIFLVMILVWRILEDVYWESHLAKKREVAKPPTQQD